MTDGTVSKRQAAREHALATGGVPLDPHPGYSTFFVRECVERGSAAPLDWLCRVYPERETAILDAWWTLACEGGHLWAWREARAKLEGLVVRGDPVPEPLRLFALVPAPPAKRGRDPEGSRAVMTELMMSLLEDEGLGPHEVNRQYGESFPSCGGRKDPGTTLRKRRARGRAFVAAAFDSEPRGVAPPSNGASRPVALSYVWTKPRKAAVTLLESDWPAFALLWHLWPSHRDAHVQLWSRRACSELWVWEALRALWDHAVYCRWSIPRGLRDIVAISRPPTPRGRPAHPQTLRCAVVEAKLAQVLRSERAAHLVLLGVIDHFRTLHERGDPTVVFDDFGPDVDDSALRRRFFCGRERLQGFLACTEW